jgi:hypothetical protein
MGADRSRSKGNAAGSRSFIASLFILETGLDSVKARRVNAHTLYFWAHE